MVETGIEEEWWKERLSPSAKKWLILTTLTFVVAFIVGTVYLSFVKAEQIPPTRFQPVDPTSLEGFSPGVIKETDDVLEINLLAGQWFFNPREIKAKAGQRVVIHMTSEDVVHGFQIMKEKGGTTTVNVMNFPGYLQTFEFVPKEPGRYLFVCHEYCGLGHHYMYGILEVE